MKNFTLSILAVLFLSACGNSAPASVSEASDAVTESVIVDSLSSKLETVEKEIDNNINSLDDALNDL